MSSCSLNSTTKLGLALALGGTCAGLVLVSAIVGATWFAVVGIVFNAIPGSILYLIGLREPFVWGGGGVATLSWVGIGLFYGLPAAALLAAGQFLSRRRK